MRGKPYFFLIALLLFSFSAFSQKLKLVDDLKLPFDSTEKESFLHALEALFTSINAGGEWEKWLHPEGIDLTKAVLADLQEQKANQEKANSKFQQKQLINCYPIKDNQYSVSIAYLTPDADSISTFVKLIYQLIAIKTDHTFKFAVPLLHKTRYWKSKKIGNITYHFRGQLQTQRAEKFNARNTLIANKLDQSPDQLDYYMCDNYQEILQLLGFQYYHEGNGYYRDGYGVIAKHIFSIMNNEDFSHDIFHYYSGKIHANASRNWITEEGIAYSWGNAYYTDKNGEMIEQETIIHALKKYLLQHPKTNLLKLFEDNSKIFQQLAPEVSSRSTISSLICDEVEKRHGKEGIKKLITCGRLPSHTQNFFKAIEELLDISKENFDEKVRQLILP